MEPIENRLFDLLESFDFDQLSLEDKSFVLSNLSENDYRQQRKILAASADIKFPKAVPLPLVLPKPKTQFFSIPIPLYRVLIGAAASIVLLFYLWPKETLTKDSLYLHGKAIVDTVYQTQTLFDTVFIREKQNEKIVRSEIHDTVYIVLENILSTSISGRKLIGSNTVSLPKLDADHLKNTGKSLKDDDVSHLLPKLPYFEKQ